MRINNCKYQQTCKYYYPARYEESLRMDTWRRQLSYEAQSPFNRANFRCKNLVERVNHTEKCVVEEASHE